MGSLVFDKKVFERFFLIILIISTFFLIATTYYSYSGDNGVTCRNEVDFLDTSTLKSYNDNFTLQHYNDSIVQFYDLDKDFYANKYDYCFNSVVNVTPVQVEVINNKNSVLSEGFITSSGFTCLEVNNFSSTLGVRCVDCNITEGKYVLLKQNNLGGSIPTITIQNNVYISSLDNYLQAEYKKNINCKQRSTTYDNYFLVLIALSLVGAFILVGVNELGRLKF